MKNNVVNKIRQRSREEWRDQAGVHVGGYRSWLRQNGELALGVGIVAGIMFVLAPSFIVTLLLLAAVVLFVCWNIALPKGSATLEPTFSEKESVETARPVVTKSDGPGSSNPEGS